MPKLAHPKNTFKPHFMQRTSVLSRILAELSRLLTAAILFTAATRVFSAEPGRESLPGHVPAAVARLTPKGRLAAANNLSLAVGLPLRNQAELVELLQQLYDPHSTNFHRFLTTSEFRARFGATEQDYQAVIDFAEANGLTVAARHPNRVVLDVEGNVSDVEQAFHVTLRTYKHPTEARDFFAPDIEPSVPANLRLVTVEGLTDYGLPRPLSHRIDPSKWEVPARAGVTRATISAMPTRQAQHLMAQARAWDCWSSPLIIRRT